MQFFQGFLDLKQALPGSVLSIGNFDGVHRGHQSLIAQLVQMSKAKNLPSVMVTFDPHPVQVLFPERPFFRLFDREDQTRELSSRGVDYLIEQYFDQAFSKVSAEDYLNKTILPFLQPKALVVGHDFVFGAGRKGNHEFLKNYCQAYGIELMIIPALLDEGEPVSSTRIRDALIQGRPDVAQRLLGRPFYYIGEVIHGQRRGHQLGVPTANMSPDVEFVPRQGVYFSQTTVGHKKYCSITNIGQNPTFESSTRAPIRIETHIFDFNQEIYGHEIKVELLKFQRNEKKFSGLEELRKQIQSDLEAARGFFATNQNS